jgi:hypothetical protein
MNREEQNQRHEDCRNNHRGDEDGHFQKQSTRSNKFFCRHCGETFSTREANRRWFGKCSDHGSGTTCFKANR